MDKEKVTHSLFKNRVGILATMHKKEEVISPILEKELGIKFNQFKKPSDLSIEENNTLLWAKQIFKTKPNHDVAPELKEKIKTVFHHLTKDELIEKLLANYILQTKNEILSKTEKPIKKQKRMN